MGSVNGIFWTNLHPTDKLFFMIGVTETVNLLKLQSDKAPAVEAFPSTMNNGQLVAAFDEFYSDKRNLRIPTTFVPVWIALKAVAPALADSEATKMRESIAADDAKQQMKR